MVEERRWVEDHGDGTQAEYFDVFQTGIGLDGKWWGEDYAFCHKWQALGGQIWIDPDILFTHSGRNSWTASLAGTLSNWIEQQMQQEAPAAESETV